MKASSDHYEKFGSAIYGDFFADGNFASNVQTLKVTESKGFKMHLFAHEEGTDFESLEDAPSNTECMKLAKSKWNSLASESTLGASFYRSLEEWRERRIELSDELALSIGTLQFRIIHTVGTAPLPAVEDRDPLTEAVLRCRKNHPDIGTKRFITIFKQ